MKDGTCGDCPLYRVKMHCAVDYGEDAHECTPRKRWREAWTRVRELEAVEIERNNLIVTLRSDLDLAEGTITDLRAQLEEALHKASHSYAMKMEARLEEAEARIKELEEGLLAIQHCVDEQADDEGLWFLAPTAAEACVQEGLRRLHACVENVAILSRYHAAEADLRIAAEQQGAQELAARCASLEEALEHAMAAVWDSYYGKGIALAYVHEADRIARQALKGKGGE